MKWTVLVLVSCAWGGALAAQASVYDYYDFVDIPRVSRQDAGRALEPQAESRMDIDRPSRPYQLPHSELLELSPREYTEFRPSAVIDQTPEVAESRFRPQFRPSEPRDLSPRQQYFAQPSAHIPKRYEEQRFQESRFQEPRFQVERPQRIKQLPLKTQKFANDRPSYADEDRYTRYEDEERYYKPRPSESRQKYFDEEPPRYREELPTRYQERPKYQVEDLPEYYEERPRYQKTRPYHDDTDDRLDYYALPDTKVEQKYEKETQYEPEEKFVSKPKYHKELKPSADRLEQYKPIAKPQAKPYVLEPVRPVTEAQPKRVVKDTHPEAKLAPLRLEEQDDKVQKRAAHGHHGGHLDAAGEKFVSDAAAVEHGKGAGRLAFQIHGQEGPHSYRFGYDTGKGHDRQFRYEERDAYGTVHGRYGYYDKHGKLQIVNYSAHPEHGFSTDHVPGHH